MAFLSGGKKGLREFGEFVSANSGTGRANIVKKASRLGKNPPRQFSPGLAGFVQSKLKRTAGGRVVRRPGSGQPLSRGRRRGIAGIGSGPRLGTAFLSEKETLG